MGLRKAFFSRPDIERQCGDLVDIRDRFRVLFLVDEIQIDPAGFARLHFQVRELRGGVVSKLCSIAGVAAPFFVAPHFETERTLQARGPCHRLVAR